MDNPDIPNSLPATPPVMDALPPAAPPAAYTPPPAAPSYSPPAPQYGAGGQTGMKDFFKGVSFTDVGMIALVTACMCTIIFYYRKRIQHLKEEKSTVQKDVEEMKVNVMNALGPNYKRLN